ncbi:MAG: RNA methyltransferase [Candidatus Poribacteria bacterium]|nr:RNA methyltransferase [Candidatus Poribacteria bacterium]
MRFYAHTTPGLEPITADEIASRLDGARVLRERHGIVHFDYRGDYHRLLDFGTTEDVFAELSSQEVGKNWSDLRRADNMFFPAGALERGFSVYRAIHPKRVNRVTYRVISQRLGGQFDYRRVDVQEFVSKAVQAQYSRWKPVAEDGHLEFWVRQDAQELLIGLRLSDRTMRHRAYKIAHLDASLRPIIARSMVWLSRPSDDDVFVDPMCGAATLVIERAVHGRYEGLLGGDIRDEALSVAARNIGTKYQPRALCRWDARRLPLQDESVSRIVCNLPFGKKIGSTDENRAFCPKPSAC